MASHPNSDEYRVLRLEKNGKAYDVTGKGYDPGTSLKDGELLFGRYVYARVSEERKRFGVLSTPEDLSKAFLTFAKYAGALDAIWSAWKELETDRQTHEAEMRRLDERRAVLTVEIGLLEQKLKDRREETSRLESEAGALEDSLRVSRENLDASNRELLASEDQVRGLGEQRSALRIERDELRQQVEALRAQHSGLSQEFERRQAVVRGEVAGSTRAKNLMGLAVLEDEVEALQTALKQLRAAGREVEEADLIELHVALKTSPFTVLTGPSGSGKSSLLLGYAEALGFHTTPIAVQPNWHSVADLHGYWHPLSNRFVETPFSKALERQAGFESVGDDDSFLDLVLLDEINLSYVEYFLADYLSALEADREREVVILPSVSQEHQTPGWLGDGKVQVPITLLIAGTANEDHTTRPFSDKFRDRTAFVQVGRASLPTRLESGGRRTVKPGGRVTRRAWQNWRQTEPDEFLKEARAFLEELRGLEGEELFMSYRSAHGAAAFATQAHRLAEALGVDSPAKAALDMGVCSRLMQKYAAQWAVSPNRPLMEKVRSLLERRGLERSLAVLKGAELGADRDR